MNPPVPPNQNGENWTLRPDCLSKENSQNSPNFDPPNPPEPEPMDISPSSSRGETQLCPVCQIRLTKILKIPKILITNKMKKILALEELDIIYVLTQTLTTEKTSDIKENISSS